MVYGKVEEDNKIKNEDAHKHFGWLAQFTLSDNKTSNALTQKWLGRRHYKGRLSCRYLVCLYL